MERTNLAILLEIRRRPGYAKRMKYWEMIADGLRRKGWSVGWFKFVNTIDGAEIWSADAKKDPGPRFIVQAEELGAAFLELEMQCRSKQLL